MLAAVAVSGAAVAAGFVAGAMPAAARAAISSAASFFALIIAASSGGYARNVLAVYPAPLRSRSPSAARAATSALAAGSSLITASTLFSTLLRARARSACSFAQRSPTSIRILAKAARLARTLDSVSAAGERGLPWWVALLLEVRAEEVCPWVCVCSRCWRWAAAEGAKRADSAAALAVCCCCCCRLWAPPCRVHVGEALPPPIIAIAASPPVPAKRECAMPSLAPARRRSPSASSRSASSPAAATMASIVVGVGVKTALRRRVASEGPTRRRREGLPSNPFVAPPPLLGPLSDSAPSAPPWKPSAVVL